MSVPSGRTATARLVFVQSWRTVTIQKNSDCDQSFLRKKIFLTLIKLRTIQMNAHCQ